MEQANLDDLHLLEQLEASPCVEPRGWFRWLHNHYMGRYGDCHPDLVSGETLSNAWGKAYDKPEPLHKRAGTPEQWIRILNRNAWVAGTVALIYTTGVHWAKLDREARGAFFAGLSERYSSDKTMAKVLESLPGMGFTPETLCQLACNAARYRKQELLTGLLDANRDLLDATVARYDCFPSSATTDRGPLDLLSNRVIDMILEAALIRGNPDAARIALQYGASPDIPIWQLERSCNHRYSALGYVLESEYFQAQQQDMVSLLLDHGASPSGIAFAGRNHELYLAISHGYHDIAERLIKGGASFQPASDEAVPLIRTGGSEYQVLGPGGPGFYGHFGEKLRWAHGKIGTLIPFVPVTDKPSFFSADAQGGSWSTFMEKVIGNIELLKRYESLGLDTRLSAEELCSAIDRGAYDSLVYLISKFDSDLCGRAMFRIRRRKPSIGADWKHLEVLPQQDGVNIATGFVPGAHEPFLLPDGSKIHVDLTAIAPPGHHLGHCHRGYFWLRTDSVILRRRKDRVVVRSLKQAWHMEPLPLRPPGTCREQRYLDECLPCIREINGQFIHLGLNLSQARMKVPSGCTLHDADRPWKELPAYAAILDEAEQLIRRQIAGNSRPPSP